MPQTDLRQSVRRRRLLAAATLLLLPPALAAAGGVTPPAGPSLIAKLKTGVDWTAFGRAGGADTTAVAGGAAEGVGARTTASWLVDGFELTGADLYRMNCRSCHGPAGQGSRSGIPPLTGALAKGAPGEPVGEIRVRHRLVDGGRVMPNFSHLEGEEVTLLLGHLRTLSGEVNPAADRRLKQSAARVGEHVVKANCQVCHDAVPGTARQPADAAVITLAEMTARFAVDELVRKVRTGTPEIVQNATHGRMPRIDYLSSEELEAAYVYLVGFPPRAERP
ncbi:MAG: c-type cytochrome [Thermoanaerobaculia bacterium]|nr:c-type cytochrome [Thermoanaerobaculia bacterium]